MVRAFPFVVALVLLGAGCCDEYDGARCSPAPDDDTITAFTVTTRTGEDQTDADLFFCFQLDSNPADQCAILDNAGDCFDEGETNVFAVGAFTPIAPGDLDRFWLENRGGGFLGNNEWEIVTLQLDATTSDGSLVPLYRHAGIECGNAIDEGDRYRPKRCGY